MPQLSDMRPEEQIKVLCYGDSGTGKTVFSCSFPGPIFVADFDGKISSAAAYYRGTEKLKQIEYESYQPVDEKGTSGQRCNDDLVKIKKRVTDGEVKTVVLDSLTTFSDEMLKYLMRINPGIKRNVTKGMQVPALQDYQVARLFFKQFIMELLAWPCNVVVTGHIQVEKDEQTGMIERSPMLSGKLARELPIYFPEAYRTYVKDGAYYAQTQADNKYTQIRSQIPGLPKEIGLSYDNLLSYLKKD